MTQVAFWYTIPQADHLNLLQELSEDNEVRREATKFK